MTLERDEEHVEVDEVNPEDILGADEDQTDLETEESEESQPTEEPEETPSETEEPAEDESEAEPEGDEPEEPAEGQVPDLVDYQVNYGGQEFTIQVTPEQAKVLDAQKTTALQFPHLQQRYTQLLERAQGVQQVAREGSEQQTAQFDPKQFCERMKPLVDSAIERGAMSEEFSEMYPVEAATGAYLGFQMQQIENALNPLLDSLESSAVEQEKHRFITDVHGEMESLASENPDLYGDLSNPETREKYLDFLAEINVQIGHLMGDKAKGTLQRLWPSFTGPEMMAAAQVAADRARAEQATKRRNAGGAGGGGGSRSKPRTGFEDIESILGN